MSDYIRIKIRRGNSADWASENPVLYLGEIGADTDKHGLKVGNGTSRWSDLPFYSPAIINDLITGGTDASLSAEQGKVLKEALDDKASKDDLSSLESTLREIIRDNDIDIVNRLDSTRTDAALSAKMGKELYSMIQEIPSGGGSGGETIPSIFGIGYTVDSFNAYSKPTQITFEDGVVANLTWFGGTRLTTIRASTGEVITINYNDDGLITGRTITRRS